MLRQQLYSPGGVSRWWCEKGGCVTPLYPQQLSQSGAQTTFPPCPSSPQEKHSKERERKLTPPNPPRIPQHPLHPPIPTPKQPRPQKPLIHMPRPKALPIQPPRDPKPPRPIRLDQRLLQTPLPPLLVRPRIQHHLGLRIRGNQVRRKHRRRRVRHGHAVSQYGVKVGRGQGPAKVEALAREVHPLWGRGGGVVDDVPAVVGVGVGEVEEGLLD